jgi:23S rRNA pseudouridine955/2504/2580 synthase
VLKLICETACSLKEFTDTHYAQASFYWTVLLRNKEIKVNGKKVGENIPLNVGDEICYYLTEKQATKSVFDIVYVDDNVLVVDKESGVNSEAVFEELHRQRECYFIHRLDRNTKGLLIFALNQRTEAELLQLFKERKIKKTYLALCFNRPKLAEGILTAYLRKDEKRSTVKIFDAPCNGAEKIVTEYKVLDLKGELCKLQVILHTGKTHQIRAHLAHIGCPIVGDTKYGDGIKNKSKQATRQQLIAKGLTIEGGQLLAYLNDKIFSSRFELEI